jgi:hypothetical protein
MKLRFGDLSPELFIRHQTVAENNVTALIPLGNVHIPENAVSAKTTLFSWRKRRGRPFH